MSKNEAMAVIEPAASRVRDPKSGRSIWMAKLIQQASLIEDKLSITLSLSEHTEEEQQRIIEALRAQLGNVGWTGAVQLSIANNTPPKAAPSKDPVRGMSGPGMGAHGGPIKKLPIPGIKHIVAVASGKGGVGKSTFIETFEKSG